MKLLKSLYKRRSRYGWLAAEIIVASAIAFFVIDPIVVSIYDASRPYNYDVDRLVMVRLRTLDPQNPAYDAQRAGNRSLIEEDIYRAIPQLASMPEVEKAIPMPERGFGGGLDSEDVLFRRSDSTSVSSFKATYIPRSGFFTTFGIKAASDIPGNPTIEEMDNMDVNFYEECILTRTAARIMYGDEYKAMEISRNMTEENPEFPWASRSWHNGSLRVVGIVEDTRAWGDRPWPLIRFYTDLLSHSLQWNETKLLNIILRLKPGESPRRMARRLNSDPDLQRLARSGALEFDSALPYSELCGADTVLSPKERYRNVLVIFFAISIFLGVFGTFWLLTRKRTEEAGIMRAFGCTTAGVRRMLYAEGALMSIVSSLIGCGIYIYYLYKNPEHMEYGLSAVASMPMTELPPELATWVGSFWQHCAVITAVVCLLMLVVVLLGIAIPALHLSRISPVDALRDE